MQRKRITGKTWGNIALLVIVFLAALLVIVMQTVVSVPGYVTALSIFIAVFSVGILLIRFVFW
jgi:hypothetical protein